MKNLILLFFFIYFITACTSEQSKVILAGTTISVEIASTPEQRQQGLMSRTFLPENHGMLFLFEEENEEVFWMKDTLIPLDIIFIDNNKNITKIHHAVPCEKDPCSLYSGKAKYVLEVNGGFTEDNNIQEGETVLFMQ